jgi:hypothetical protein
VSWDPYLDLQSGVLRNRLGITDKAELAQAEAELPATRSSSSSSTRCPAATTWRTYGSRAMIGPSSSMGR